MLEILVTKAPTLTASLPVPTRTTRAPATTICRKLPVSVSADDQLNCGASSLRMIFESLGKNFNQQHIEHITCQSKLFGTSPFHIKRAVESVGLRASIRNYSTSQTVISVIDSGGYAMAIVSQGNSLRYEVINGYRKHSPGRIDFVVTKPNGSEDIVPLSSFERKWANPRLHGVDSGFRRCVIAIGKQKLICERISGNASRNSFFQAKLNEATKVVSDLSFSIEWFFKAVGNLAGGIPSALNSNHYASDHKSIPDTNGEFSI